MVNVEKRFFVEDVEDFQETWKSLANELKPN